MHSILLVLVEIQLTLELLQKKFIHLLEKKVKNVFYQSLSF